MTAFFGVFSCTADLPETAEIQLLRNALNSPGFLRAGQRVFYAQSYYEIEYEASE
jgi:hypothetical protein